MAAPSDNSLAGYEVLLCVTGGIACYKSADLTSKLVQSGAGVSVAMTDSALKFMTPLTFQTLTARAVFSSMWQIRDEYDSQHIALTEAADLMIVAPATANFIGKMAGGIADDLVSALAMSATGACPVLIAPAMNDRMWASPAVQANLKKLQDWSVRSIGPAEGRLACGAVGMGRMVEPAAILAEAQKILQTLPPKKRKQ